MTQATEQPEPLIAQPASELRGARAVAVQRFVGRLSVATLYLGDCREIAPTIQPASCDCLLADPPYGMGKENEGVLNDNLYGGKLDAFLMECWRACRPSIPFR